AGAALGFGQEQVPQSLAAGLLLQLLKDGRMPPLVLLHLLIEQGFVGVDVFIHEGFEFLLQILNAGAEVEHNGSLQSRSRLNHSERWLVDADHIEGQARGKACPSVGMEVYKQV